MGKHSKNNNDRGFFSHAERKAAAYGRHSSSMLGGHNTGANFKEWGWGTESRTLDSDSMKDIDACSLTLQPCVEPVVTPSGVLYDKEAIIKFILARKKEIARETEAWEAQQASDASSVAAAASEAHESRIQEFVAQQEGLSQADLRARAASGSSAVTTVASMGRTLVMDKGRHAADTSFWVVSNTPEAQARVAKPDGVVRCPITNEPLKLKAMIPVIFTPTDEGSSSAELVAKKSNERYMCPLSKKALSNVNPVTILRPSGMALSTTFVKDCIRKDMLDPFTDPPTKLKEKDIVALRVEGTGFAARTAEDLLKVTAVTSSSRM
uniref:Nitric oxide synthase-interacting protein zinc-finger domain-containing protein n=1 Tax=Haptolina brevifila TaxID=156173 RepID=A0A7S2MJN3_9EUKA|mmetsp:Transcript_53463/g.106354  ORF Transcript_53463/g.106354 Transcript_53463/m.106354 type:complete len:323 (+) Transcript_53463:141-1109(+)|eukprot:CAMPEP_0174732484 /NCGR_PEP_ID=MMETSP1094-20130205/59495_1 /TAXON_ID=156173 /ORGANISM="Chrysochromulina brevifilum, Strain UTEX LB 985" /LENGTH=322 /DNA_ID=CAMNT_0015935005 /DNA_START=141 /DNA_END=1109 /DNA_ORIENTATION=+